MTADGATWTTVTITPSDDIAALWPDLDYRDFALWELYLNAASTGGHVAGVLRLPRVLPDAVGRGVLQPAGGHDQRAQRGIRGRHRAAGPGGVPVPAAPELFRRALSRCPATRASARRTTPRSWQAASSPGFTPPAAWSATTTRSGTATSPPTPRPPRTRCSPRPRVRCSRTQRWAATCWRSVTTCAQGVDLAHHLALWNIILAQRRLPHRQRDQRRPFRHGLARHQQQLDHLGVGREHRHGGPGGGARRWSGVVWVPVGVRLRRQPESGR